ncbi:hypothetical protein [Rickettsia endosymbiont of Polydrusus tereticollis]
MPWSSHGMTPYLLYHNYEPRNNAMTSLYDGFENNFDTHKQLLN